MRKLKLLLVGLTSLSMLLSIVPAGTAADPNADAPQPATDLDILFDMWDPLPDLEDLDNWRSFNAYNAVYHVAENLPHRQPGDTTSNDPHGDPNPGCRAYGPQCAYNHQLEYLNWFEEAYTEVLGDFGVSFQTTEFTAPGSILLTLGNRAGRAINKFAIVPGADNPEDYVLIGSHYDGVNGSPYAAWDSTAGSGTMLRTAKMLADYWKATGTRPSRTYIFVAWDGEEQGLLGSEHFVDFTRPVDPNALFALYVNHDPCGGHYPAVYRGMLVGRNPAVEETGFIPVNVALHQPQGVNKSRFEAFNASVTTAVDTIFERIDETLPVITPVNDTPAEIPVFLSTAEAEDLGAAQLSQRDLVNVNNAGSMLFSTDAEAMPTSVPTLNPYPDVIGPHRPSTNPKELGYGFDGLWAYHSPHDNWNQLVAQTSIDQTGLTYSKGLAMSFEFCALLSSMAMVQPAIGGAQTQTEDVVAHFWTPKPNQNTGVFTFDASSSYRYTDLETLAKKSGDDLEYHWSFGDGTEGEGRVVTHDYGTIDRTNLPVVTLTVTDPETQQSDTMRLRVGKP